MFVFTFEMSNLLEEKKNPNDIHQGKESVRSSSTNAREREREIRRKKMSDHLN